MMYYDPDTNEERTHAQLCAMYHASFPADADRIRGIWHKVHETDPPAPEDGHNVEPGAIRLIDGHYTRVWEQVPLTPEERQHDMYAAAMAVVNASVMAAHIQTASFRPEEFATFAQAGLFTDWTAGQTYAKGYRLTHEGVVYEVMQEVTAIEDQPPDAAGMLAVYRPLSVDPETGDEPDGSREHPFAFLYGMDVKNGSYYSYEGKLWLARADMPACVWVPGTAGLWQWEEAGAA